MKFTSNRITRRNYYAIWRPGFFPERHTCVACAFVRVFYSSATHALGVDNCVAFSSDAVNSQELAMCVLGFEQTRRDWQEAIAGS